VRIAQVIAVIDESFGGPSISCLSLNAELRRQGIDATIYTTDLRRAGGRLPHSMAASYEARGSRVALTAAAWPRAAQNSWQLLARLIRDAPLLDLIHLDGQYMLPHVYAYLVARRWRIPYGIQPHGTLEPFQRRQSRLKKRWFNWAIGSRILRDAAYVLFTSETEAANARDVVDAEKVLISPLGASLTEPARQDWIATFLERSPRERRVLFLGRLAQKKQPDLLLETWARISPDNRGVLVFAGPDDDHSAKNLIARAEQLGVRSDVLFTGHLGPEAKSWLFQQCGIFVLPSQNENFALTVPEAMLAGCHVITTSQVAASEFLIEAKAGVVLAEGWGADDLLAALRAALSDAPGQIESGKRASRFAAQELSWAPTAKVVIEAARRLGPPAAPS
jgi:glycosyltransferase involved in cell wall biosynthesis